MLFECDAPSSGAGAPLSPRGASSGLGGTGCPLAGCALAVAARTLAAEPAPGSRGGVGAVALAPPPLAGHGCLALGIVPAAQARELLKRRAAKRERLALGAGGAASVARRRGGAMNEAAEGACTAAGDALVIEGSDGSSGDGAAALSALVQCANGMAEHAAGSYNNRARASPPAARPKPRAPPRALEGPPPLPSAPRVMSERQQVKMLEMIAVREAVAGFLVDDDAEEDVRRRGAAKASGGGGKRRAGAATAAGAGAGQSPRRDKKAPGRVVVGSGGSSDIEGAADDEGGGAPAPPVDFGDDEGLASECDVVEWGAASGAVAPCGTCGEAWTAAQNAIVHCSGSGCAVRVHQRCYGVGTPVPPSWKCDRCV